jgi:hypothetical protein
MELSPLDQLLQYEEERLAIYDTPDCTQCGASAPSCWCDDTWGTAYTLILLDRKIAALRKELGL